VDGRAARPLAAIGGQCASLAHDRPLKRIGCLVEALGPGLQQRERPRARCQRALATGIVALDPGDGEPAGRSVTFWQLLVNVAGLRSVGEGLA